MREGRKEPDWGKIGGIAGIIGTVAAVIALGGYTLKDFFDSRPEPKAEPTTASVVITETQPMTTTETEAEIANSTDVTITEQTITTKQVTTAPTTKDANIQKADELFQAGARQIKSKNFYSAIGTYEEYLSLRPSDPLAWNNLGVAYIMSEQYESAIYSLTKALEHSNDKYVDYNTRDNRGAAFFMLGRDDEGVADIWDWSGIFATNNYNTGSVSFHRTQPDGDPYPTSLTYYLDCNPQT